jgi:hypothetical protein
MRKNLGSYVGITLMTLMLLTITVFTFAQDVVVLKHTNYTSHYSKSKKYHNATCHKSKTILGSW